MGYLTKEQHDRRTMNAARRNENNYTTAIENGLTEYQAALINKLCSIRHQMHCNVDRLIVDNSEISKDLILLNVEMKKNGIEMSFIPSSDDDFIDIDDFNTLDEIGDEYDKEDEYARIYSEWEEINRKIENFLHSIDIMFGTNFAPTGALRI